MPSQAEIKLSRMEQSQPWGMRLKGGADQGIQLYVEHVQPNGRAHECGVRAGDLVVAISGIATSNLTHSQVKQEMVRAGNDIQLVLQRDGAFDVAISSAEEAAHEPRAVVDEQPLPKMGGPTFKNVQQKTFQILEETLPQSETHEAPRPASIFDRNRSERSDYLKAKGATIQKAYGE